MVWLMFMKISLYTTFFVMGVSCCSYWANTIRKPSMLRTLDNATYSWPCVNTGLQRYKPISLETDLTQQNTFMISNHIVTKVIWRIVVRDYAYHTCNTSSKHGQPYTPNQSALWVRWSSLSQTWRELGDWVFKVGFCLKVWLNALKWSLCDFPFQYLRVEGHVRKVNWLF